MKDFLLTFSLTFLFLFSFINNQLQLIMKEKEKIEKFIKKKFIKRKSDQEFIILIFYLEIVYFLL